MPEPQYYSLRRLSPYQGTVQVVELPGFRAFSGDGRTWQIQISHEGSRFSSYATWRFDGQGKDLETEHTAPFIEALRKHPTLPFAAADRLELWLLDTQHKLPLALVSSTFSDAHPPKLDQARWYAAGQNEMGFVSPSLQGEVADTDAYTMLFPHHEVLRRCIAVAAGSLVEAQWFRRNASGCGRGLSGCRIGPELYGRYLESEQFPELIVNEDCWDTRRERELVRDYHNWQAPNLLTHMDLQEATRDRLEYAASKQAIKIYRLRHVIPEIINQELMKTVFVQAMIEGGNDNLLGV